MVNLAQSRVPWEERLSEGLSGSDWPVGMFTGDGLDCVNWGGTTQPVSGQCPQGLGPHYTFKEDKENGAGICRHARLLSAPDCVRMWPTVSSSCLWHLLSDRVHPGIVNENNPFSAQTSFSGSAVLAAGNKTNTASLSCLSSTGNRDYRGNCYLSSFDDSPPSFCSHSYPHSC